MSWFGHHEDAYNEVYLVESICPKRMCSWSPSIQVVGSPHKAELSHELIAAAASFEVVLFASYSSIIVMTLVFYVGC